MWIVFLSRSWWINSSSDGKVICFFFFFSSKSKLCDNLHVLVSFFEQILSSLLFLRFCLRSHSHSHSHFSLSLSLLLSTIHLVFPRSSFLFIYWHELREYGTTTPLLLEFDVGRNPFFLFFFFLLAGKVVRWMSMQCAHVCFLRYFKRFFQNGGIDGSRRSSKCRVANTFLTVVEENRNDLDDLVKIPTYLVRCIV